MINLLPDYDKKQIAAGRSNLLLLRYNIVSLAVLFSVVAILATTWLMLNTTSQKSADIINENEASSADILAKQEIIRSFKDNLQSAKIILDKQIDYSTVAVRFASTLPSGVIIDKLSLDPSAFDKPTTLTAFAKSEGSALRLREAFSSSPYFSNVKFESIANSGNGSTNGYPLTVTLSLVIKKGILYD